NPIPPTAQVPACGERLRYALAEDERR
ncbi:MAG: hypothetical protein JWO38_3046, partial [Gemmataceae bacterium]|nr:hypothetical protein [Gemmataceae bacterium]